MPDTSLAATFEMLERAEHISIIAHVQPLNDRVLLRRIKQEGSNQVRIPDAFVPKSNCGEVLAVGPVAAQNASLHKGDKVLFSFYGAQDITIDEEELVLISVHDIWLRL